MLTHNSERWRAVSPYLDEALDMPEAQRAAWFSELETKDPDLVEQLRTLLAEHESLSSERFLEKETVLLPGVGLAGQVVGHYRLLSQVGHGGMGTVWLAERVDGRFDQTVAVKFLNIALMGRVGEERFKREGRILGRLTHPNIARLLDAGLAASGQPYLVLEYVEGEHIDRYCDDHKLDLSARIRLFLDVLAAVAHAHSNLIVHRDIKPSNVLVGNDGAVKLLDFSIAKPLEGESDHATPTALTIEGGRAMTPEYAAPEQLKGGAVTTATDVYALGVLLYVLLTGEHPAGHGPHSPADLVSAVVEKDPPRPSDIVSRTAKNSDCLQNASTRNSTPEKLRRQLAGDLDTIITKALKKDRTERYASVTAFADDLHRYLRNQPIGARPDTLIYRAAKFVRRNRTAVVLTAFAVIATVAGLVGTVIQSHAARAQRDFALQQMESAEVLNEFHEFVLSDAAPSGKPFTVNDLLDRATGIINRQHAADDPNRLRLLLSIGYQYLEQDQAAKARPLLEEVYKRSRTSPDVAIRARASCLLGVSLSQTDDPSRAEAFFHQGLAEIPPDPQFALVRRSCLRSGTEIAVQSGNATEAVTRARMAQSVLRESIFNSGPLELESWIDLATAYNAAGMDEEAVSAFGQANALLSSLGRDQTETAAVLFCNWGLELDQLGRPLEAESKYKKAIEIERTDKGEDVDAILQTNYSRTLEELGRLKEAADYASRAYSKAHRVGYSLAEDMALFEVGRVATAQKDASRATMIFNLVEPKLHKRFPDGHYGFAVLDAQRALVALSTGNLDMGATLANRAISIDEAAIASGNDGAHDLPGLLTTRSSIELAASHTEAAAADASRAVGLVQPKVKPGTYSSILGIAYLALGRARQAQGKTEDARAAFRSAAENLQNAVGPDHPDTRAALHLTKL